jgi:hypothetical protein
LLRHEAAGLVMLWRGQAVEPDRHGGDYDRIACGGRFGAAPLVMLWRGQAVEPNWQAAETLSCRRLGRGLPSRLAHPDGNPEP